jgi:uncharacterized protein YggE
MGKIKTKYMNPKIKDWLGLAALAAVVILTLSAVGAVFAYRSSSPVVASFNTTGEGKVNAVPDIAEFSFGVTTEGGVDVAALEKQNTDKANAAIAYVKSQGVEAKDIQTDSYNISPRYQYFSCPGNSSVPCRPSEISGYTISQTVHVKVRDFAKTGTILSGIASKGVNNVSGLNFTIDNIEQVKSEARGKAVADAKEKAAAMAKAGGFRIGRILSIQETGSNPPPIYYSKNLLGMGGATDAANQSAPAIEPGSTDTTVHVTVTYEIR